jgi:NhaP-type Na+/H+ or K+/H+ antiporter
MEDEGDYMLNDFLWQNPVADIYSDIWKLFQPVLFGLIGTEIDLSQLEENTILYGLCVLAVGLTVSIVLTVLE